MLVVAMLVVAHGNNMYICRVLLKEFCCRLLILMFWTLKKAWTSYYFLESIMPLSLLQLNTLPSVTLEQQTNASLPLGKEADLKMTTLLK